MRTASLSTSSGTLITQHFANGVTVCPSRAVDTRQIIPKHTARHVATSSAIDWSRVSFSKQHSSEQNRNYYPYNYSLQSNYLLLLRDRDITPSCSMDGCDGDSSRRPQCSLRPKGSLSDAPHCDMAATGTIAPRAIEHLVIGPAGMNVFSYMGAVCAMEERGFLDNLKSISGASAGALTAVGYIMERHSPGNWWNCFKYPTSCTMSLRNIFTRDGLMTTDEFAADFVEYMGNDYTFRELYDIVPIDLYISAYCIEDKKTEHFNHRTHPDIRVSQALGASMAIPFAMTTVEINGKRYLDGGLCEKFPVSDSFDPKATCLLDYGWIDTYTSFKDCLNASGDKGVLDVVYSLLDIIVDARVDVSDKYAVPAASK